MIGIDAQHIGRDWKSILFRRGAVTCGLFRWVGGGGGRMGCSNYHSPRRHAEVDETAVDRIPGIQVPNAPSDSGFFQSTHSLATS